MAKEKDDEREHYTEVLARQEEYLAEVAEDRLFEDRF